MVHFSCDRNTPHFKPICEPKQKSHKNKNRGSVQVFNEVHSSYSNHNITVYSRSKVLPHLILHAKYLTYWRKILLQQELIKKLLSKNDGAYVFSIIKKQTRLKFNSQYTQIFFLD